MEKQEKYKYLFGVKRDLTVASILDEIQKPDELFIIYKVMKYRELLMK